MSESQQRRAIIRRIEAMQDRRPVRYSEIIESRGSGELLIRIHIVVGTVGQGARAFTCDGIADEDSARQYRLGEDVYIDGMWEVLRERTLAELEKTNPFTEGRA